ncbi:MULTISPECIES: molecular chaperone HscC [unclassified Janthinobacterium]|uniref:molecular chaperone HscC n=1 Tax=unclassified Janthinobacterium TaxID=2610881 RepID=UPI00161A8CE6|nr:MULTISPECIES: molecular chaperone HscC [unclassified Janthinobacterium]MBB5367980.1 molecular chaperone HscC [Janthinobacterium sp. K2C7]MBB5379542.1 molecular chaperone HscC [Janthinobacterium sp. K2Li3]MBB5386362.1 molecular chaperone HscC [Janthinobacterium sp. K2E3]
MIIGIDLGTTNSLAAIWRDGKASIIPNALGEHLTPSCVSIDEDGSVLVGRAARERLQTHPQLTASVFKRYMGSEKKISLGTQQFRPEELSSMVLRVLKEDAEAFLGHPVKEAIITVPAYFSDAQRKATRIAGQLAGLRVERLLNEPTAAALAYGIRDKEQESKFLVFDLGGGTFDVSILELFEGVMEVRASAGDNFLGGEDFVTVLVEAFLDESGLRSAAGSRLFDTRQQQLLRDEAERVKRLLSEQPTARMSTRYQEKDYHWEVSEDKLAQLCEPLLARLRVPVERALRDATIRASELNEVVLAGGATRMPLVRKLVSRMFGRFPAIHLDPDEAVALGAAVQAGLKMRDAALDEVVMTDVAPYSLGIGISRQVGPNQYEGGHYMPIIERNSVVPVSRTENITTIHDNQKEINVTIYQGESRLVADNVFLGKITFPIPAKKAGEVGIDVRFTYDISGVLEAEVTVLATQERHKMVISDNAGVMTPEQIEQRFLELADLKIHPREQMENRTLISRADRLYEQSLGDVRNYLAHHTAAFQAALETQDSNTIRKSRLALDEALRQVESESFL